MDKSLPNTEILVSNHYTNCPEFHIQPPFKPKIIPFYRGGGNKFQENSTLFETSPHAT